MQVPLFNQAGDKIGTAELRDDIFGITPNETVMHQALVRQLANARLITTDQHGQQMSVTLAHEQLIMAWPWLKQLITDNRAAIAQHHRAPGHYLPGIRSRCAPAP